MEREIIQRVFNRDFRQLLGLDIFSVVASYEYEISQHWWNILHPECYKRSAKILTANLIKITTEYLTYNETVFPEPLDQYIYIYENRDNILSILKRNLEVDTPFDDPHMYHIVLKLEDRFQVLFTSLLTCGKTHKFDPDIFMRTLDMDPNEPI